MKTSYILFLALLILTLSSASLACDPTCCSSARDNARCDTDVNLMNPTDCMNEAVGAIRSSIVWTSRSSQTAIRTTSETICEIPEGIEATVGEAGELSSNASRTSVGLMEAVGQAIVNFTSSLLRIIFSSTSALVSVILSS